MVSSLALFSLLVVAFYATAIESRTLSSNNLREKRQAYRMQVYPPRALMFTNFYRPVPSPTFTGYPDTQASSIFAQGNTVGGGAFFQPRQQLQRPRPFNILSDEPVNDESEIAMSQAVATPDQTGGTEAVELEQLDQPERVGVNLPQENTRPASEESAAPQEVPTRKSKPKKAKKIPVIFPENDDDDDDDDNDYNNPSNNEEDEEQDNEDIDTEGPDGLALRPHGKNRQTNKRYGFNNYFPVVFTLPSGLTGGRRGSVGDVPGLVTAIANSYSTSKGGVASSVATAYGGTPAKKPKRPSPSPK